MNRAAVVFAVIAIALSAGALTVALMNRPANPWPLVCGESFHDAKTGQSVPMYVPCSEHKP